MNEITLDQNDLQVLAGIIAELPHKYAVPLVNFLQKKLQEQKKDEANG